MCECLRRDDGTWHVDECCAEVMDDFHSGKFATVPARRAIREQFAEELLSICTVTEETNHKGRSFDVLHIRRDKLVALRQLAKEQPK